MTRQPSASGLSHDQTRVTVLVEVSPELAFQIFTEDIDLWWRRGLEYRVADGRQGTIHLEPGVGGRLFESFVKGGDTVLHETGRVTVWNPPHRLAFQWRAINFDPRDTTEVQVDFEPTRSGTRLTVTHGGWSRIRNDHPVRHGLDPDAFVRSMAMWWGGLMTSLRARAEVRRSG